MGKTSRPQPQIYHGPSTQDGASEKTITGFRRSAAPLCGRRCGREKPKFMSDIPEKSKTLGEPSAEAVVARIKATRDRFQRQLAALSFSWRLLVFCCIAGTVVGGLISYFDEGPPLWKIALLWYSAGGALFGRPRLFCRPSLSSFDSNHAQQIAGASPYGRRHQHLIRNTRRRFLYEARQD